jgi:hypothetical protein
MTGCAYVFTSSGAVVFIECRGTKVINLTVKIAQRVLRPHGHRCADTHSPNSHSANETLDSQMDFANRVDNPRHHIRTDRSLKKDEAQLNEATDIR